MSVAMTDMKIEKPSKKKQKGQKGQESLSAPLQTFKKELAKLENCTSSHSEIGRRGAIFTHWGSRECSRTSKLIYGGFIGGSNLSHLGVAINYLCLPCDIAGVPCSKGSKLTRQLYGVNFNGSSGFGACAVCSTSRSTSVMIPGKTQCPGDWTTEYAGYLEAGRVNQFAVTEFICVDRSKYEAQFSNNNHRKSYAVRSHTSGLFPSRSLEEDKELAECVVCSK